jgi:hypothetical protein
MFDTRAIINSLVYFNNLKTSEICRRVQKLQKQLKVYHLSFFGLTARLSPHASSGFREDLIVSNTDALDLHVVPPSHRRPRLMIAIISLFFRQS